MLDQVHLSGQVAVVTGGRRIINVASAAGLAGIPYFCAYETSKTALIRFIETLSLETRDYCVSVFVISPETVRTYMSEGGISP